MQYRPSINGTSHPRPRRIRCRFLAGVVLLFSPLLLASCRDRDQQVKADTRIGTAPSGGTGIPATISDLVRNPSQFAGKTVTVSGEVNRVLGPKAFTIGGSGFLPSDELLVTSPKGFPQIPDRPESKSMVADDLVQVTGQVQVLRTGEINPTLVDDLFGKEDHTYMDWEGKPMLVVSSMITTPREHAREANAPLDEASDIIAAPFPLELVGRSVKFHRTNVVRVVNQRTFWAGSVPSLEILVRYDGVSGGTKALRSAQPVSISGTLRKTPPLDRIDREWKLDGVSEALLKKQGFYIEADRVQQLQK